jgi:hypothetical protein
MNSRHAQDVILRLLADGPYRTAALAQPQALGAEDAALLSKIDLAGLDRFARFLCRHYYRERVVHYFKYSRALTPLTGRPPEAALKTEEFKALVPSLTLGERASAERVLDLLRHYLNDDAGSLRARVPYWDDLIAYQGAFFLSDALPPERPAPRYPARAESAIILELSYDLPSVLPQLLKPIKDLPLSAQKPTRLLLARSAYGEVTALRCTDALKGLLDKLTGDEDPARVAAAMGVDPATFDKTLRQLEQLGAVVAREFFSSSHVGSDLPAVARPS